MDDVTQSTQGLRSVTSVGASPEAPSERDGSRQCDCGHSRGLHRPHEWLDEWYGCEVEDCQCEGFTSLAEVRARDAEPSSASSREASPPDDVKVRAAAKRLEANIGVIEESADVLADDIRVVLAALRSRSGVTPNATTLFEERAAAFHRATGMIAPGKSVPAAMASDEYESERQRRWAKWCAPVQDEGAKT